jgi:drug/metabolite transporter (DMT)-like permease
MTRKSLGIYSGLLGVLIAAALFVSIFWITARFMPAFLNFTNSRWRYLLPALASLMIGITGLIRLLKSKRRAA